jgi:hypothetical protein
VASLCADPAHARFIRAFGANVESEWAIDRLACSLGISHQAAMSLFGRGHTEAASVVALTDAELRSIPKIGPKTVASIRASRVQ